MKYCTKCGTAISSQAQFCPNCGLEIKNNLENPIEENRALSGSMEKGVTKSLQDQFENHLKQEISKNLQNAMNQTENLDNSKKNFKSTNEKPLLPPSKGLNSWFWIYLVSNTIKLFYGISRNFFIYEWIIFLLVIIFIWKNQKQYKNSSFINILLIAQIILLSLSLRTIYYYISLDIINAFIMVDLLLFTFSFISCLMLIFKGYKKK